MPLQPGARLGPYAISVLLGQGGMGEVYRAVDTRIDRIVAIKILPADAAANAERRQRFEREARAVARLNHPNICALYDLGDQDGIDFLVMEFVAGETLAARLKRGALPIVEALRHSAALASALAAAHQEGIVHRDIKPSNIMLTESGAKLLDFGLAKLHDERSPLEELADVPTVTEEPVSHAGRLIGTYTYMAPEQLRGRPADRRTDIFAFGLVMYEMVTGRRAFTSATQAGMISAILETDPPALSTLQPNVPPALERIVQTCLAKNPDARWQDARDLARELEFLSSGSRTTMLDGPRPIRQPVTLRRLWPVAAAAVIIAAAGGAAWWRAHDRGIVQRNLVVLPCRAIGDDAQTQAYCDGMADTLSAKLMPLGTSHGLQMTSTLEARQHHVTSAADAHRQFGATLVLEGSIFRSGDTVRVNYAVVDAAQARQIDAFSTTAPSSDPFALQDRVAEWAVGALALNLDAPEQRALTAHGTDVPLAYELYLQGRGYLLNFEKPSHVDNAIELFERALTLDSRFALAYAGAGQAYWLKYLDTRDTKWVPKAREACGRATTLDAASAESFVCVGTVERGAGAYDKAIAAFRRALELQPTSDEAYLGLANTQAAAGDFAAAERTYQHAIELRPDYAAAHSRLAVFYRDQGRYREAAAQFAEEVRLTPQNPQSYASLGGAYTLLGRYQDAIAAYNTSIALTPNFGGYANLGMTYFRMRRFPESVAALEQATSLRPSDTRGIGSLARAVYWSGDRARAQDLLTKALGLARQDLAVNPRDVDGHILAAEYLSKLGRPSEALEELAKAGDLSSDPHRLLFAAFIYNQAGERDRALTALETASARGLPRIELDAWVELDNLRSEPRFKRLLR